MKRAIIIAIALVLSSCCVYVAERMTSHPHDPRAWLAPRDAQLGVRDAGHVEDVIDDGDCGE